ncbi:MAG TPA: GHKL domain-containing protein [Candidatus Pelethenecus sp.]|nr:GHKL domain-containing protein [Candidatus Pelethenecus sp.]
MKSWMFVLSDIIGLILIILILKTFFQMFGVKRWRKIWIEFIVDSLFVAIGTIINIYKFNQIIFAVVFYIIIFSYSWIYKIKPLRRIYSSLLSYIMIIVGEILMGLLVSALTKMSVEESLMNIGHYIVNAVVSKLIVYVIIKIISSYVICKTNSIPKIAMLTFIVLPTTTFLILYFMSEYIYRNNEKNVQIISFVLSLLLIISNIVVFFILDYVAKQKDKEKFMATKEQQLEYERQFYSDLYEKQVITDKVTHDIKNKFFAIRVLIKEDINKAEKELDNISKTFNHVSMMKITGNAGIDALLYHKLAVAKENNIKTDVECLIGEIKNIDIVDLCVIFGNLLDNSIEACLKIENFEERFIKINIKQDMKTLQIKIINAKNSTKNNERTTKKDKIHHGFGTENIKDVIDKYNGYYVVDETASIYTALVGLKDKDD